MSISSINAQNFYQEVAKHRKVYTIKDDGGFPAPKSSEGKRAQPFWSLRSRAEKVIKNVPAYKNFELVEIRWEKFRDEWIPELSKDKILIGVNWSGKKATGYDMEGESILKSINFYVSKQ